MLGMKRSTVLFFVVAGAAAATQACRDDEPPPPTTPTNPANSSPTPAWRTDTRASVPHESRAQPVRPHPNA
jgi:hypothetical protein